MKPYFLSLFFTSLVFLSVSSSVHAASVLGGTGILAQTDADQLEAWLDEGPLQLTSLGALTSNYVSALTFDSFHNLADNHGRTFVVIEAFRGTTDDGTPAGRMLVGGYNPRDWVDSRDGFVLTPQVVDMTAFIFNLTSGVRLDQSSQYQAGAPVDYPAIRFGLGDLFIPYDGGAHSGLPTVTNWNYCAPGTIKSIDQTCLDGSNLVGETGLSYLSGGPITLEAFAISNVPLPPALWLFGSGLLGIVPLSRRREPC